MRYVLLAALLIGVPSLLAGGVLVRRQRRQGPGPARGGPVSGWLAHRRALRLKQVDHENAMHRETFRSALRIREQALREHRAEKRRQNRGGRGKTVPGEAQWADAGEPGTVPAPAPEPEPREPVHVRLLRLWPEQPPSRRFPWPHRGTGAVPPPAPAWNPPDSGSAGSAPGAPGPRTSPRPEPPARGEESPASPESRPAPGPSPVPRESRTIEGVVVTIQPDHPGTLAVPGVEMIIEGAAALRRHAMAGNVQAKRRAVLGIGAGIDVLAATVRALAMDMSEPGQHYGPEITDPLTGAASHCNAASTVLSEIDGRLLAILRAAEELAASGVQAPHHGQMAVQ